MAQDVQAIFSGLQEACELFKVEFMDEFLTRVQERTPVDTGFLQKNWEAAVQGDLIIISNDAPYAGYIEYGTPRIAPFAMLGQTVAEADVIAEIAAEAAKSKTGN